MDSDNFKKLLTILDLLDNFKLALAHSLDLSSEERIESAACSFHESRDDLKRGLTAVFSTASSPASRAVEAVARTSSERRRTIKRKQTLLQRRQTRAPTSLPSLPQLFSNAPSLDEMDSALRTSIVSRGLRHLFSDGECDERASRGSVCHSDAGPVSDSEATGPDVDWESSAGSFNVSASLSLLSSQVSMLSPSVLGQMFDRIIDILHRDFDELLERLKAQNLHLKQDVASLRRKLEDAVQTNDDQVQELKDLGDRATEYEKTAKEFSKQVAVLEERMQHYKELEGSRTILLKEKQQLEELNKRMQQQLRELNEQASSTPSNSASTLSADLISLRSSAEEKDREIDCLKRRLDQKEKELEAARVSAAALSPEPTVSEPPRSSTPRGSSIGFAPFASPPRRQSVRMLLQQQELASALNAAMTPRSGGQSLASELSLGAAGSLERQRRSIEVFRERLKSVSDDAEELRRENQKLRQDIEAIRADFAMKEATLTEEGREKERRLREAEERLALARATDKVEENRAAADREAIKKAVEEQKQEIIHLRTALSSMQTQLTCRDRGACAILNRLKQLQAGVSSESLEALQTQVVALEQLLSEEREKTSALANAASVQESMKSEVSALAVLAEELRSGLGAQLDALAKQQQMQEEETRTLRSELQAREAEARAQLAVSTEEQRELRFQLSSEVTQLRAACRALEDEAEALQKRMQRLVVEREEELSALRSAQEHLLSRLVSEEEAAVRIEDRGMKKEASDAELELLSRRRELLDRVRGLTGENEFLAQKVEETDEDGCSASVSKGLIEEMRKDVQRRLDATGRDVSLFQEQLTERSEASRVLLERVAVQIDGLKTQIDQRLAKPQMEEQRSGPAGGSSVDELFQSLVGLIASNWNAQQRIQKAADTFLKAEGGRTSQGALSGLKKDAASLASKLDDLLLLLRQEAAAFPSSESARASLLQDRVSSMQELMEGQRRLDARVDQFVFDMQNAASLAEESASVRRENENLKREVLQLKSELERHRSQSSSVASSASERSLASIAQSQKVQQKLLQTLASEFGAFKNEEIRQMEALREEAASARAPVFNVAFPPFVIPLVNIHENASSRDKTISISGMLDVRAAAFALSTSKNEETETRVLEALSSSHSSGGRGLANTVMHAFRRACGEDPKSFFNECCGGNRRSQTSQPSNPKKNLNCWSGTTTFFGKE